MIPESSWLGAGFMGVNRWEESVGAVAGCSRPGNGAFSVADPRFAASANWNDGNQYGVKAWKQSANTIAGQQSPGQGAYAVADPRHQGDPKFNNCYRVAEWHETSPAVTGGTGPLRYRRLPPMMPCPGFDGIPCDAKTRGGVRCQKCLRIEEEDLWNQP
jgi:hypothetical protein